MCNVLMLSMLFTVLFLVIGIALLILALGPGMRGTTGQIVLVLLSGFCLFWCAFAFRTRHSSGLKTAVCCPVCGAHCIETRRWE